MSILYIILSMVFALDEQYVTKTHTTPFFSIPIPYIYHIQGTPLIGTIKFSEVRTSSTSSSSDNQIDLIKAEQRQVTSSFH